MRRAGSRVALGGLIVVAGAPWLPAGAAASGPEAGPPAGSAVGPQVEAPEPVADFDEEYRAYLAILTQVMAGDTSAGAAAIEAGARLGRLFDRRDAERVARYYAGLTEQELAAGRRAESHYRAVWQEVLDARRELAGIASEAERVRTWRALREELDHELRAFVERVAGEADFVPAARASSLLARLDVHQVEIDPDLTDGEALLQRAQNDAERSLELFKRAGMVTPTLEPLWTTARIDFKRKHLALARQSYEELFELSRHVRNDTYCEHALKGLIWIARELGDVDEIDRLLQDLAHVPTLRDRWFVASKHARSLLYQDEPEAALAFLERNRPVGKDELHEWNVLLAGARLRRDDLPAVRRSLDEVGEDQTDRALALAQVALREGRFEDVVEGLGDDALLGSLKSLDQRALAFCVLAEAQLALREPRAAIASIEAALAAADRQRLRFEGSDPAGDPVINVQGEVVGVHAVVLLARAHAELGEALEAARVIEELQSRRLAAHRALPAEPTSPAAADAWERTIRAADVRAWAGAYELGLITWAIGADSSLVVHVAPDGNARAATIERGRRSIREGVRRLREAVVAGDADRVATLAREIHGTLIPDELAARLAPSEDGARLLCLLHGPLEELPIEALFAAPVPRAGASVAPLVLPGLPDAAPGAPLRASDVARWTLLGDPLGLGDGLLGELPGARAELADLDRLYGDATLHAAAAFDREALATALAGDRALHVATHFVPVGTGRRHRLAGVGLLLSGGDVFDPAAVQAAEPRLPLVVLSACESQTGRFLDGEGLHGIARAFLEAGTRNLLVTLWPVEDQAAREYALAFHRALGEGRSPSRAAAAARAELRRRGFAAADWAAFRLVGRD